MRATLQVGYDGTARLRTIEDFPVAFELAFGKTSFKFAATLRPAIWDGRPLRSLSMLEPIHQVCMAARDGEVSLLVTDEFGENPKTKLRRDRCV